MSNLLELTIQYQDGRKEQVGFACRRLYNAGYAGRDQEQVRSHIQELAEMGVPAPGVTPTLFPLSARLLSTAGVAQVQCADTSGEVEYVLLMQDGRIYLTVGSDHSDRALENFSVAKAKQVCPDVIAGTVWL
mgnify:CR=1 FL=1